MLDTARHFHRKQDILRVLDGMMYSKLNVLHLHFTDDESFPLYIKSYPNISKYGSFSDLKVFSEQDI